MFILIGPPNLVLLPKDPLSIITPFLQLSYEKEPVKALKTTFQE